MSKSINRTANCIRQFIKDESGSTAIEYGLLAALVGVAIISGASTLGENTSDTFEQVAGGVGNTNAAFDDPGNSVPVNNAPAISLAPTSAPTFGG